MFGNEICTQHNKHLTYAIGTFFKFPDLQHSSNTELWYLDHGEVTMEQAYTRDEAMMFMPTLHNRAVSNDNCH